jgi:hypothetical protein
MARVDERQQDTLDGRHVADISLRHSAKIYNDVRSPKQGYFRWTYQTSSPFICLVTEFINFFVFPLLSCNGITHANREYSRELRSSGNLFPRTFHRT